MDARELEALILEQGVMIDDIQRHLRQISKDLDEVLELVRPVSDHAQWVDHLRHKLDQWNLLKNVPRLTHINSKDSDKGDDVPLQETQTISPTPAPVDLNT